MRQAQSGKEEDHKTVSLVSLLRGDQVNGFGSVDLLRVRIARQLAFQADSPSRCGRIADVDDFETLVILFRRRAQAEPALGESKQAAARRHKDRTSYYEAAVHERWSESRGGAGFFGNLKVMRKMRGKIRALQDVYCGSRGNC